MRGDFFIVKTLPLIGKVSKKGIFLESIKVNAITDQIEVLEKIKDTAQKFSSNNIVRLLSSKLVANEKIIQ